MIGLAPIQESSPGTAASTDYQFLPKLFAGGKIDYQSFVIYYRNVSDTSYIEFGWPANYTSYHLVPLTTNPQLWTLAVTSINFQTAP